MPTCVPIKDLKDTAKFAQMVEDAPGPVIVTRNGYDAFVVMRSSDYDAMQQEDAKERLLARITLAEQEKAEGRFVDGPAALEELRAQYGI